jgi:hypothetical protein
MPIAAAVSSTSANDKLRMLVSSHQAVQIGLDEFMLASDFCVASGCRTPAVVYSVQSQQVDEPLIVAPTHEILPHMPDQAERRWSGRPSIFREIVRETLKACDEGVKRKAGVNQRRVANR